MSEEPLSQQPHSTTPLRPLARHPHLKKWLLAGALIGAMAIGAIGGTAALATFASANPSTSTPATPKTPAIACVGGLGPLGRIGMRGLMKPPMGLGVIAHPGEARTILIPRVNGATAITERKLGALTVSSVNSQSLTAKRADGSTVTILTTSSTIYLQGCKTISRSAITANQQIYVLGSHTSNGQITAKVIGIVLPMAHGKVTNVSGNTITVQNAKGTQTIHVSASTTIEQGGQQVNLSAVKTGEQVIAEGTLNSDGSLNAQMVQVVLPIAAGQITKISGSTITVQNPRGTQTIQVNSRTSFISMSAAGQSKSSLSALKTGELIIAQGTLNSDGSLTASVIHILPALPIGKLTPFGVNPPSGTLSLPGMLPGATSL